MKTLKDNWAILLFVALIVFGNSFVKRYTETIDTSDRERYQIERDSLLNEVYERGKREQRIIDQLKYTIHERIKDSINVSDADPSLYDSLAEDYFRKIGIDF